MRSEQQLRDALNVIVERTPDADGLRDRLLVATSSPSQPFRWRPVLVAASVAIVVALVGAIALPYLTHRPVPEPPAGRGAGSWTMASRITVPPGWATESREMTRTFQTTTLSDPTGKGICRLETDKRGVAPQTAISGSAENTRVGSQPALFQQTPGRDAAVYWHYVPNAWASVSCSLGPKGLAAARTSQQIRDLVIRLAETVTFGQYPLRLPIRIELLPAGYTVQSVRQGGAITSPTWGITLSPDHLSSTTPTLTIGPDTGSGPEPNIRVAGYRASFFTNGVSGPAGRGPRTAVSYTSLCVSGAPVPICVVAENTGAETTESRRDLLESLAGQITYAPDATDTTAWFDAAAALPS